VEHGKLSLVTGISADTCNIDSGIVVGVEADIIDESDDSVASDWLWIATDSGLDIGKGCTGDTGTDSCLGSSTTDDSCARD
jgi:hypothetical protein